MAKLTRKEIVKRTMGTLIKCAEAAGGPFAEQGRIMLQIARRQKPAPEDNFAAAHLYLMYQNMYREAKRLASKGCTEEELENYLNEIRTSMAKGPTSLRKAINDLKKTLPRQGGPGRKELLSQSEKREAVHQVAHLLEGGKIPLPDIFQSVASGMNRPDRPIKARTIRRAWEKRREL